MFLLSGSEYIAPIFLVIVSYYDLCFEADVAFVGFSFFVFIAFLAFEVDVALAFLVVGAAEATAAASFAAGQPELDSFPHGRFLLNTKRDNRFLCYPYYVQVFGRIKLHTI